LFLANVTYQTFTDQGNLQYEEKSFGLWAVVQPACNSAEVVVLRVTASEPKKECKWLLYCPGITTGSIFLCINKSLTMTVYALAVLVATRIDRIKCILHNPNREYDEKPQLVRSLNKVCKTKINVGMRKFEKDEDLKKALLTIYLCI
jgi:hypothetical protein